MTFAQSVKTCLGPKYLFVFKGRASRSEFWWFMLFIGCANLCASLLFSLFPPAVNATLCFAISLLLFPANLGVSARRLHDRNLSAWWLLVPLATLVLGGIGGRNSLAANLISFLMCFFYLVILCMPSQPESNRFGPMPADPIKNM